MRLEQFIYNNQRNKLYAENNHIMRELDYPYTSKGVLIYDPVTGGKAEKDWLILQSDEGIVKYYTCLLEKRGVQLQSLLWGSHISVVRGSVQEQIRNREVWGKYEGKEITFQYGDLVTNNFHWWLEVQSKELETIREELGLQKHPCFWFHLTVGKIEETFRRK